MKRLCAYARFSYGRRPVQHSKNEKDEEEEEQEENEEDEEEDEAGGRGEG